jgi:hypothetical protein
MTAVDPKAAYDAVRLETQKLLGLRDPSLLQSMTVDAVSLLRLSLDAQTGAVLAGRAVDLSELGDALGMLGKLLPAGALQAGQLPAAMTDAEEEETERLWAAKMESLAVERMRRLSEAPDQARAELEAEIAAAMERFPPAVEAPPWGAPPSSTKPAPTEPTTGSTTPSSASASPSEPATKTPWPPPLNSPPMPTPEHLLKTNQKRPPAHYLRSQQDEMVSFWGRHFL